MFIGLYRLDSLSNASFLVTRFFLEFFTDVNKELNKNKIKKLIQTFMMKNMKIKLKELESIYEGLKAVLSKSR